MKVDKNIILFGVLAVLSYYLVGQLNYATVWGAGLTTDSVTYADGAKSILDSASLDGIGTHYPPLYFLLIAALSLFTSDVLLAMKSWQIVLMVFNFLLFNIVIWDFSKKNIILTLTGVLIFITSLPVFLIHSMAWSEATFSFLTLLGFYLLAKYLAGADSSKLSFLVSSGIAIGLAFITRYVGLTAILSASIVLFIFSTRNIADRVRDAFIFWAFSLFPMILWVVHNIMSQGEVTSRDFVAHPIAKEKILAGISVIKNWFFLDNIPSLFVATVLLVLSCLVIYFGKRANCPSGGAVKMMQVSFSFVLVYIVFLLISISFFDAHTPLNDRILFPVYQMVLMGFIMLLAIFFQAEGSIKYAGFLILLLMVGLAIGQEQKRVGFIQNININGIGFASRMWTESDVLHWLNQNNAKQPIYTNGPDAIGLYTDQKSIMLPRITNPIDRKPNENFEQEIGRMVDDLNNGDGGIIIVFYNIKWRWYLPSLKDLEENLPLEIVYKGGMVLFCSMQIEYNSYEYTPKITFVSTILKPNHNHSL